MSNEDEASAARPPGGHGGADESTRSVFARRYRALSSGVIMTVGVVAFESLGVATVLPVVARELGGLGSFGWGLSALMLANIVGAVLAGRAADRNGPAAPFAVSIVVFAAGCLLAAVSPSWPVFTTARAVQGFGVGGVMAIAFMSIGATYPERLQPRMYALLSSAWSIPALAGPPIGGLVAETIGWPWVFVGIVPIAVGAALLTTPAMRGLVEAGAPAEPARGWRHNVVLNSVLLTVGTAVLLLALEAGSALLVVAGAVVGLLLAVVGLRHVTPPGTLVARRGVASGIVVRAGLCGAYFGTEAFLPLGMSELRGVGTTLSGLGLAVGALTWVGGSFWQATMDGGKTRDRSRATALGSLVLAVGSVVVAMAILVQAVPAVLAVVGWAIGGLGMGIAVNASTSETMRLATPESLGLVSSSLQLAQTLATALLAGLGGGLISLITAGGGTMSTALLLTFALTVVIALGSAIVAGRFRTGSEEVVPAV
ncbi:MFS transporter [Prauserella alba]|uniref:MFS transporter n=1 Tax=Prauserella alba TaxID=176898 RepID=A0ABN1VHS3_9PSEU|nr:MFS transporter [Prauserella alba]MCP2179996.1 putative arabinose efflux permease, MFS family [Prauserella alba]